MSKATTTLDFYWDLASLDESKRIDAATKLIVALCEFQAAMPKGDGDEEEVAKTEEELDRICAGDVSYGLRRLIKGLTSPRDGARQGFSMALTELLSRVPCISVRLVLDLIWKHSTATKGMKGSEQRDMFFGRIFGLTALVQSGILARSSTTPEDARQIIKELSETSAKKKYLREICYITMIGIIPSIEDMGESRDAILKEFVEAALHSGSIETPEELYLAMRLRSSYPDFGWKASLSGWHGDHMLNERNKGRLVSILCESSSSDTSLFSNWHPHLHTVWDDIFSLYFDGSRGYELNKGKPMPFETLWSLVVENGLFKSSSSAHKRYWGLLLVERVLPHLNKSLVPSIITPNMIRCLSANTKGKKQQQQKLLNKISGRVANKLLEISKSDNTIGLAMLTHLLNQRDVYFAINQNSSGFIVQITRKIMSTLDDASITGHIDYLIGMFNSPESSDQQQSGRSAKGIEKIRSWAIDQLVYIVRVNQLNVSDKHISRILDFILLHASYAIVVKPGGTVSGMPAPVPEVSDETRTRCCRVLLGFIGDLNRHITVQSSGTEESNHSSADSVTKRLTVGCSSLNGDLWGTIALKKLVNGRLPESEAELDMAEFDKTLPTLTVAIKSLDTATRNIKACMAKKQADVALALKYHSFQLLLSYLSLVVAYTEFEDDRAELLETIPEITECLEKTIERAEQGNAKGGDGEGPEPVEVLTEVLISLLTKPSTVLRKLCEQVFVPFVQELTPTALGSIISVLQSKEGVRGDDEESEQIATTMDVADDMVIEEPKETEEGDDSDSDLEDADEDMAPVDEELRKKIQEALGQVGMDVEQAEEASASGEEETYNDEQMTVFDDKLAEIFHHKKQEKRAQKELKISYIDFKLRVLDLADVVLTKTPKSPLVIDLISAILDLAKATTKDSRQRPIYERTLSILSSKRASLPTGFDVESAYKLLSSVHDRARKAADKHELDMAASMSVFVTRALLECAATKDTRQGIEARIMEEYQKTLVDFMTRKSSHVHTEFFNAMGKRLLPSQTFFLWSLSIAAAREYGLPLKAVNVFRQVQAYELAESAASTLPRITAPDAENVDMDQFLSLAKELSAQLKSSVTDTIKYALSDDNKNARTGKLALDNARVREIVECALGVFHKLSKDKRFAAAARGEFKESEAWSAAFAGLSESPKFKSPVITRLCSTALDVDSLFEPVSKKRKAQN